MWISHPTNPANKAEVTAEAFTAVWSGLGWTPAAAPPSATVDPNDVITRDELILGPGAECGFAIRGSNWQTTNTVYGSTAAAALVPELAFPVLGTGRAIELEIFSAAYVSTANNYIDPYILVDGAVVGVGAGSSPVTTTGRGVFAKARIVVPAGVTKTIQAGAFVQGGTGTLVGLADSPMTLQAVRR